MPLLRNGIKEKTSSKENLPSGKENVKPSTSGVKNKQTSFNHQEDLRKRLSLSSNDDREKGNVKKSSSHPVRESFPVKKTRFHVHCDERNTVEDRKPCQTSKIISSGYGENRREDYEKLLKGNSAESSTHTHLDDQPKNKKLLPSRIPRRFRSSSACAPNKRSRGQIRRSASVEVKTIRPEERWCKAADLKFGWSGGRVAVEQSKLKLFAEETRGLIEKPVGDTKSSRHLVLNHKKLESIKIPSGMTTTGIKKPKVINKHALKPINQRSKLTVETARISRKQTTSSILKPNRNLSIISNIDRIGPRAIDQIKANLMRQDSLVRASNAGLRSESNTETPVDGSIPPTLISQGAIRKKTNVQRTEFQETQETNSSQHYDYFSWELLHHEYQNELPLASYEREIQAPELSNDFLKKHLNVKQRRLVIIFMLRLGRQCRYPSFIVFQAVKLFDAVMDRINVEIPYIQLIALSSLWIALKRHQNFHKIPTAKTMVGLAGDLYVHHQDLLIKYEQKILLTLNFNITFADPFSLFTHYLIRCRGYFTLSVDAATFIYYVGGYLIDITLLDESLCRMSVCLIALSAIELALGLVIDTVVFPAKPRWLFWRGLLFTASSTVSGRFTDKDIDQIRIMILNCVINSEEDHGGFNVVYKKYSHSRYGRISTALLERVRKISPSETYLS